MNLTEMITFVRSQADTDADDAPQQNLEVYARAAYNDIKRRVGRWLDQSGSDTLTVTAGTASYTLSGAGFTSKNLEYPAQVVGETETVSYVPWEVYLELLEGPDVSYTTREASHWTVRDDTIYLFPTPSVTSVTYTVYGDLSFTDWPDVSNSDSFLPSEFDEPIMWFMLSKYYLAQEDLELASMYMNDYERQVDRFIQFQLRQSNHQRVLGGRRPNRMSYSSWMRRNTEG